jgi:hypothetical protein
MLVAYRGFGSRFKINWDGWVFSAFCDEVGGVRGLHDQDFIHNGKKMINPIHLGVQTLQLVGDMVVSGHLGLVYQKYTTDEHGMKLEEVTQDDRQNWALAQCMCQVKV